MKEYDVGIKHKRSAPEKVADSYVIEGKPGDVPLENLNDN